MRKILIISILLFFTGLTYGQNCTLRGNFLEPKEGKVYLVGTDYWFLRDNIVSQAELKGGKQFEFRLTLDELKAFHLMYDEDILGLVFLEPSDNITIDINLKNFPNHNSFIGTGSEKNIVLYEYLAKFSQNAGLDGNYRKAAKDLELDDFIKYTEERKAEKNKKVAEYLVKYNLPKPFINYLQNDINYTALWQKIKYHQDHYIVFGNGDYVNPGKDFYDSFKPFLQNDAASDHFAYMGFLGEFYIDRLMNAFFLNNKNRVLAAKETYSEIKSGLTGKSRDLAIALLFDRLINKAELQKVKIVEDLLVDYKTIISDHRYLDAINSKLADAKSLSPGMQAPELALMNEEGKLVNMKEFKGRFIVVDFWGTWCKPCLESMPELKKLKENYSGRDDIVFVTIAMENNNVRNWKKAIKKYGLNGINLYAEGGFAAPELTKFKITSAPRYFLIDKDMKIFSADGASPISNLADEISLMINKRN